MRDWIKKGGIKVEVEIKGGCLIATGNREDVKEETPETPNYAVGQEVMRLVDGLTTYSRAIRNIQKLGGDDMTRFNDQLNYHLRMLRTHEKSHLFTTYREAVADLYRLGQVKGYQRRLSNADVDLLTGIRRRI